MTDVPTEDLAALDPETLSAAEVPVEQVRAGLASEDNQVRTHAAQVVAALAADDAAAARPLVPDLAAALGDERTVVNRECAAALAAVAEASPADARPAVDPLVAVLDDDVPVVRLYAAGAVRPVAAAHPEWFAPHVERLLALMAASPTDPTAGHGEGPTDDPHLRERVAQVGAEERRRQLAARTIVANVVLAVAQTDPEALTPHVDALVDLVRDAEGAVLAAAAGALAAVAETDPDAVVAAGAVDPLRDCLTVPDRDVLVHAVTALGYVGDPAAVDDLRAFAAGDDPLADADGSGGVADDDLRELAAETADWLAGQ